jgi:hypothetical protein
VLKIINDLKVKLVAFLIGKGDKISFVFHSGSPFICYKSLYRIPHCIASKNRSAENLFANQNQSLISSCAAWENRLY